MVRGDDEFRWRCSHCHLFCSTEAECWVHIDAVSAIEPPRRGGRVGPQSVQRVGVVGCAGAVVIKEAAGGEKDADDPPTETVAFDSPQHSQDDSEYRDDAGGGAEMDCDSDGVYHGEGEVVSHLSPVCTWCVPVLDYDKLSCNYVCMQF